MHYKLDDYVEMATALQIYDKNFLYVCISLAKSADNLSDLTSLVEVLSSKKNKDEILDFLILQGRKELQNLSQGKNFREMYGNPRDEVKLNLKEIDSLNINATLKLLLSASQTRGLTKE